MHICTCKYCGKEFESSYKDVTVCKECKNRPCEICGKPFVHEWPYTQHCCSKECYHVWKTDPVRNREWTAKREATVQKKYGVKNVTYLQESKDKAHEKKAAKAAERRAQRDAEKAKLAEEKRKAKEEQRRLQEEEKQRAKLRKCKACGKLFMPTAPRNFYCKEDHYGTCKVCGQSYLIKYAGLPYPRNVCYNSKCATEWRKRCNIEKYGIPDPGNSPEAIEKRKNTNMKRYGVDNPARLDEIKARIVETNMKKYGAAHPTQTEEFKQKQRATLLANWGEGIPELVERRRQTCLKKYGISNPRGLPETQKKIEETCMERYGVPYPTASMEGLQSAEARRKARLAQVSKINKEFKELLDQEGWDAQFELEVGGRFFDLWSPDHPILVEIDPTFTHYTDGIKIHPIEPSPSDSQLKKSLIAEENGYHCVHVFDWDDRYQVVQMLKRDRERIYARKCEVVEIDPETARDFEAVYHLQGSVRGQLVNLGLDYNGELVEVMTFGVPRYNKNYQWELLRLCTHFDYTVVGGASKLFSYFINTYHPESILSYCDRAKFSGDVYKKMGMTLHHVTDPAKIWSKGSRKITDNLLRQRGYDQLFGTDYGKGTSNEQLMIENGWRSVYDCGQLVFEWRAPESEEGQDDA